MVRFGRAYPTSRILTPLPVSPIFDAVGSATVGSSGLVAANAVRTFSLNVTNGDLVVMWCWTFSGSNTGTSVASATVNSVSMALAGESSSTSNDGHLWCFTCIANTTGSVTVSVTNGTIAADMAMNAASYTNAAVGTFFGAGGASAAASVTASGVAANQLIAGGIGAENALTNTGSGQTQRGDGGSGSQFLLVTDGPWPHFTVSASLTSTQWAAGALVLT